MTEIIPRRKIKLQHLAKTWNKQNETYIPQITAVEADYIKNSLAQFIRLEKPQIARLIPTNIDRIACGRAIIILLTRIDMDLKDDEQILFYD